MTASNAVQLPPTAAACPLPPRWRYRKHFITRFISRRDSECEMGQTPLAPSLALVPRCVSKTTRRVWKANGCSHKPNLPQGEHPGEAIEEVGEEAHPKHHLSGHLAWKTPSSRGCRSPPGSPAGAGDSPGTRAEEASLFLTGPGRKELLLSVYLLSPWPGHPARRSETCCSSASSPRGPIS